MVFATITIAYHAQSGESKIISVGASALNPNDVSSALNITLPHLSYTTQPPQFLVTTNYAENATYSNVQSTSGVWVANATYQIFQHNASTTAPTTAAGLSYYMKGDTAKAKEYFSDSKIGLNGTGATSTWSSYMLSACNACGFEPVPDIAFGPMENLDQFTTYPVLAK